MELNGVLVTFLALIAVMIIGYEIGEKTALKKMKRAMSNLADELKKAADKLRLDEEKKRIERAAKEDSKKEGDIFESVENSKDGSSVR